MLERGEGAHDVRRAARAPEPRPSGVVAVVAAGHVAFPDLQRVGVDVALAVERQPGQEAVVERALDQVGVARLAGDHEHPPAEHHRPDRGARLAVAALVGQLVRVAERLVGVVRPDAAGDVRLGRDHLVPEPVGRRAEGLVAVLDVEVGHAGEEVDLSHRVPLDRGGLTDRGVVLEVVGAEAVAAEQLVPAPVDEAARGVEVALLARLAVELDQGRLDLGVPVDPVDPARPGPEGGHDQVGDATGDVEEPGVGVGAVQGDGGLDQVAGAVELVTPGQLDKALAGEVHLEVGVEVAVLGLRGLEQPDRRGQELLQPGLALGVEVRVGQRPGQGLEPLVEVAVEEGQRAHVVRPGVLPGRELEVQEVAGLVQPVPPGRDADLAVDAAPLRPQPAGDAGPGRGDEHGAARAAQAYGSGHDGARSGAGVGTGAGLGHRCPSGSGGAGVQGGWRESSSGRRRVTSGRR